LKRSIWAEHGGTPYKLSTQGVEAERFRLSGQTWLYNEFKASLGYIVKLLPKKKKN
jgi:hypothetical protein